MPIFKNMKTPCGTSAGTGRLFSLVRESQRRTDGFDQAVADYLNVSRTEARITKITDRLVGLGYVRRASDPRDRRRVIVELTARARRLANDLYVIAKAAMTGFQHQFSDDDIEVLVRYFEHG